MVIDASDRYADHEATRISELTWSGPCIGGLAMGEGWVSEGEYRYVDFPPVRGWAWYGRRFGVMETRQANGSISFHQFIWDGKHVSYNTLSTAKPTWPGAGVSFPSQVADTEISVSVSRKLQFDRSYLYSVSSHDRRSGSNVEYKCPNPHSSEGCDALWAEHAGPVIDRIKAFIAENKPKADALKRQIAPLIAHWRPSPNAKRDDASRHAALREQHLAERAKREADLAQAKRENERFEREYQQRQAEQQAKDEKLKAEAERERAESQRRDEEGWAMLRNAVVAATGGRDSTERKQLALESLTNESGTSSGSSAYGDPTISILDGIGIPSASNCVKLEWVNETEPSAIKVGSPYFDAARNPIIRTTHGMTDRKFLLGTNICKEDIVFSIAFCADLVKLKASKYAPVGAFDGFTGQVGSPRNNFKTGQSIVIAESFKRLDNRDTPFLEAHPVKISWGAWKTNLVHVSGTETQAHKTLSRKNGAVVREFNRATKGVANNYDISGCSGKADNPKFECYSCKGARLLEVWNSTN